MLLPRSSASRWAFSEHVQPGAVAVGKSAEIQDDRLDRGRLQEAPEPRGHVGSGAQVELAAEPHLRGVVMAVSDLERYRVHTSIPRPRNGRNLAASGCVRRSA